jgi:hypothetical protein
MSSPRTTHGTLTRGDAAAYWFFLLAGAAIAAWTTVTAIVRIVQVLPNVDVVVPVRLTGISGSAPLGRDGGAVPVALETASVTAERLPGASLAALVLQQVVLAGATIVVVALLLLLTRSLLRGEVFSRRNTRRVNIAAVTGFAGFVAVPFLGNMVANGAVAGLSGGTIDTPVIAADWAPIIAIGFGAALASTVFTVGDRMRRDTEGLI